MDKTIKAIYKMEINFGRMGDIEGVFVATQEQLDELIASGEEIYFGEILGKHSEVMASMEDSYFKRVTDNPEIVTMFEDYGLNSGYNPFDYRSDDEEED